MAKPIWMKFVLILAVVGEDCEIECSNVIEPVCGEVIDSAGASSVTKFQNICFLERLKCRMPEDHADVRQVPSERCGMRRQSRRVYDFTILGAHQVCNHTCPTYCVDVYDPVCAIIHYYPKDSLVRKTERRSMLNHCHVDLLSCSLGVNVSIAGLNKCASNQGLIFLSSVAAMKTLGFLNEGKRRSLTPYSNVGRRRMELQMQPFDMVRYASDEIPRRRASDLILVKRLRGIVIL